MRTPSLRDSVWDSGMFVQIKRTDALRVFILMHYGGLYLDLDIECYSPAEATFLDHDVVLQGAGFEGIGNGMMASRPGHPLFMQWASMTLSSILPLCSLLDSLSRQNQWNSIIYSENGQARVYHGTSGVGLDLLIWEEVSPQHFQWKRALAYREHIFRSRSHGKATCGQKNTVMHCLNILTL